jgi:hypothetical protein
MTAQAAQAATYDVHLRRRVPDALREQFPVTTIGTTEVRTVLRLQVHGPRDVATVLEKLASVGVSPVELHRTAEPDAERGTGATYEVSVAGELGDPLLQYLGYEHYVVPEETRLRLLRGQETLHPFLRACIRCGAVIERVRRVDPVEPPGQRR